MVRLNFLAKCWILLTLIFTGCGSTPNNAGIQEDQIPVGERGEYIQSGSTLLIAESQEDSSYGIALYEGSSQEKLFGRSEPLEIQILDGKRYWVQGSYSNVEVAGDTLICRGTLSSENGALFEVTDSYAAYDDSGSFTLSREVVVKSASGTGAGFASRFGLQTPSNTSLGSREFFAPGVWYRDNEHVPEGAIGSDYSDQNFFFRETRLAAPFFMMRNQANGRTLTIAHKDPNPGTFQGEHEQRQAIDERMQFGSLGVKRSPGPMLGFLFPGSEGEINYIDRGAEWSWRYHPIEQEVNHSYELILKLGNSTNFDQALKKTWRYFYGVYDPPLKQANLQKVYHDGVALLEEYTRAYNDVWGLPFSVFLDGEIRDIDYYMAFVGGQLSAAYHLINYGYEQNRPGFVSKGENVTNFWVNNSYDGASGEDRVPHTWYQPVEHERFDGGIWENEKFWRPGPSYLRVLGEGHLAALRAYRAMREHNEEKGAWIEWVRRFGDWLVAHQNGDGSYYRAYHVDGSPAELSKNNTTHAIPFLVELYQFTGNESYMNAAVEAGEYALSSLGTRGVYVGGTPDNPDVIDKEAALLALDAFLALYESDGHTRWLDAAAQAATYAETWNYIWDIPMAEGDRQAQEFDQINTAGLSLVATGHSYADYYNAFYPYQYYKLYKYTGDEHFYDVAVFLLHNTKQLLDTDGSKGYGHPGLQTEGIVLAGNRGSGADLWLPWVTLAHIDPLLKLKKDVGGFDIR